MFRNMIPLFYKVIKKKKEPSANFFEFINRRSRDEGLVI